MAARVPGDFPTIPPPIDAADPLAGRDRRAEALGGISDARAGLPLERYAG